MNNKVILNIIIIYFVILCVVLGFQLFNQKGKIAAPSNSQEVTAEERLNNAIVICEGSPVMLVNKQQTLLDKTDSGLVPAVKGGAAYVPASFFKTAYDASVTESHSGLEATVRMDGKALVLSAGGNRLIDNSKEKELSDTFHTYREKGSVYIPLSIFAEAFNKYLYYYDGMIIIANEENAFGNEDTAFIAGLRTQVDDLPYVVNEQNLLEICNINTNDILKIVNPNQGSDKQTYPVGLMNGENSLVQADDGYIYRAAKGRVDIIDYNNSAYVGRVDLGAGFMPDSMYIKGDTLAIVGNYDSKAAAAVESTSQQATEVSAEGTSQQGTEGTTEALAQESTLESTTDDNKDEQDKPRTALRVYNISQRADAQLLREFRMDGEYVSSSRAGDNIYLLSRSLINENVRNEHFVPPTYYDSVAKSAAMPLSFENMQYFPELGGEDYIIVAAVSIADTSKEAEVKPYLCAGKNVYLSGSNLFIARNRFTCFDTDKKTENSHIYKIKLSGGISLEAHTAVKGYIANQSCMNEDMGYFRAVTSYESTEGKDIQNIYVMNNNLELSGEANKVAEGGNIASALFTKNKIFLVPAKAENPTYIVDITDPLQPRGNGILHFSEGTAMLYPYDENHIIILDKGREALKLRFIDINGEEEPKQLFAEELGRANISSAVFEDSSDFYYDSGRGIFAVPVTIMAGDAVGFDGCYIYSADEAEGFKRIGVSNASARDGFIRLGSGLYMFTDDGIQVAPLTDLTAVKAIEVK